MVKCPKCRAEVSWLRNFSLHWTEYVFELNEKGDPTYQPPGSISFSDPVENEYACPECESVLFKSEEKALAFLKG